MKITSPNMDIPRRIMRMNIIREWISIKTAKVPGLIVLLSILAANVIFISIAALIIMSLAPPSLEDSDFWSCVYYALTMLITGYMEIVDVSQTGVLLIIFCMLIVIIGMIVFTGAVIGYMTDFISNFIENADTGFRKLHISNHIVILNWNTRAAEIINELLHKNTKEKIVVLVEENRDDVLKDIDERLSDTIEEYKIKNKLTIIVREGDSWSSKQLNDISIKQAKSVIILNSGCSSAPEGADYDQLLEWKEKGNANTIKTLLQVAHLTGEEDSADNQQVVVEVENDWTMTLAETVIEQKNKMQKGKSKCNIIPLATNQILGQVFSQFAIMPELNIVYDTLFSNKGVSLHVQSSDEFSLNDTGFISDFLDKNLKAIPLAIIHDDDNKYYRYYLSDSEKNIHRGEPVPKNSAYQVSINPKFEIKDRHIIILGHNSKSIAIMDGFKAFSGEWKKKDGPEVLDITVIDNEANLVRLDFYKQYPFVTKVVAADIFDKDLVCSVIGDFIDAHKGNGCIMILSDDMVADEDIDVDVLTYLVLLQNIINQRLEEDTGFEPDCIDLVVEIQNPKNHDIISNYSAHNIVISNRYISKMIMQIGEKEAIYNFYNDILNYDEPEEDEVFLSKEIYIKKVADFFNAIPGPCTAAELIRAIYHASPDDNKSIVLGYFRSNGKMTLFKGDQSKIDVALTDKDKLILFSNH